MYYAVKKAPFLVRTFAPHRLFFAHSDLVGSHHATESDPASCSFIFPSHLEKGSTLSSQMQCYNNVSRQGGRNGSVVEHRISNPKVPGSTPGPARPQEGKPG